ncbi:peptidase domain-containing ABC transporter [Synechococcus sp. A15-28]|uniref:ABC transporter transmembrane domain-containing protein n=1 Tax=Synechococcus sp. A15-28 TaxID=1050638 RepID=UPI0016469331|nr:peptidase domain-containing ABC transporter [Synechococcus sp. A15-28]QNI41140.1 ABC multidrug efflux transporter [Synechococcus sp. A15-28]
MIEGIIKKLSSQHPYDKLESTQRDFLFANSELVRYRPGELILRPDELPSQLVLVLDGAVRLLSNSPTDDQDVVTLDIRGSGQLIGWSSLLRAGSCEWVIASQETTVVRFGASNFVSTIISSQVFREFFGELSNIHESIYVLRQIFKSKYKLAEGAFKNYSEIVQNVRVISLMPGCKFSYKDSDYEWFLSTENVPSLPVGSKIDNGDELNVKEGFNLPYRLVGFSLKVDKGIGNNLASPHNAVINNFDLESKPGSSLSKLGIIENESLELEDKFPAIKGFGPLKEALAAVEMVALMEKTPFKRDILEKILEEQFRRNKPLSLELLARLCELLGLTCQIGGVNTKYIDSIELPSLMMYEDVPIVVYSFVGKKALIGHPHNGITKVDIDDFINKLPEKCRFATPKRIGSTPRSKFGWNWFTPLLSKYKKALTLVFVSSLLAQLFGLGVPLLIQQIIDKVLSQGNLSSLNVLGGTMIVLALFQGILTALRTYIFVDTTDRMDLTLGSAVIDRLLALPLGFFEKRPVGELSQRIGELNTIRGFLTGTALVSVLNIIFASLYLVVMIIYSPLLTAVSLSTLPVYFLIVFVVAPIYKGLIRKRAIAQAKTQSHLIEVLGGIQTVKAQHFELTARWKWQDRYRQFVNEGFKSVALGTTSGVIGSFLNQLSSLLVLWVGMWLVLEGELTLGMLIAFRIISGNVTNPLLQLSGLYQGFQTVQLAMERLSDILDQNPELSNEDDLNQISLPPIVGSIRYEDVCFRFGKNGPYQVDKVSLSIAAGDFIGIVGQSGSGKSTLVKLLPRLYSLNQGRLFIDDYDIEKVNLSSLRRQIGIVPQDSLLFEGTVADNIALNDPQATNDSIIAAAKIACAHDFIMSLGQGYATPLSERGSNLSGGQRQRIAIARTILSNPRLLIMDEATSALDYNTEKQLCANLQSWAQDRTVLFITHRLSTIRNSDLILVMHEGRLVEQGSHQQLMDLGERYCALFKQQGN